MLPWLKAVDANRETIGLFGGCVPRAWWFSEHGICASPNENKKIDRANYEWGS